MKMKQNKVLLVAYGRPFGGAEIYMGRLAQLLKEDASFYALCDNDQVTAYLSGCGVHVFSYAPVLKWKGSWKLEYSLVCALVLPYLRLRYRIDTIWIQGFREAILLPWARLLGYSAIVTMHVTLERSISQLLYPYLILCAQKVICVSQSVEQSIPAFVQRGKVAVVQNWVSSVPKCPRQGCGGLPLRLLYVGRLVKYKGCALILEAMRELKSRGKSHCVSLTIVGDGEHRSDLERQADGLNVHFAGFLRDPASAYENADLFINPTLGPEGSPLVSLEAMSYGLPCILSDLAVNREISGDGEFALLFRGGDATDLCAKIETCINSSSLLTKYGRLALKCVASRHSRKMVRARYIEEIGL